MKQADDKKTVELPGVPKAPAKRGRKPLGDAPMTAAERKRRSLAAQLERGGLAMDSGNHAARCPVPFSTTMDNSCVYALQRAAKDEGVPMYVVLERIIAEALIYKKRDNSQNKPAVAYVHPEHPASTWTGKGKKPAWVTDALASGYTLDQLKHD